MGKNLYSGNKKQRTKPKPKVKVESVQAPQKNFNLNDRKVTRSGSATFRGSMAGGKMFEGTIAEKNAALEQQRANPSTMLLRQQPTPPGIPPTQPGPQPPFMNMFNPPAGTQITPQGPMSMAPQQPQAAQQPQMPNVAQPGWNPLQAQQNVINTLQSLFTAKGMDANTGNEIINKITEFLTPQTPAEAAIQAFPIGTVAKGATKAGERVAYQGANYADKFLFSRGEAAAGIKSAADEAAAAKAIEKINIKSIRQEAARIIESMEKKGAETLAETASKEAAQASLGKAAKVEAGKAAVNTANYSARKAWLTKFVSKFKDPLFMAGAAAAWITSGVFAFNELNDAIQTLGFQAQTAEKAGDTELAKELLSRMEQLDQYNKWYYVFAGPAGYIFSATTKGGSAVEGVKTVIENREKQAIKDELLDAKYAAGTITPEELADYIVRNPYSAIAQLEKTKSVQEAKEKDPNNPYGKVNPDTGQYEPTPYEIAKQEWQNSQYDQGSVDQYGRYIPTDVERAKSEYYNSLRGSGGSSDYAPYEPPSSLNFGLLRTAGGYELGDKSTAEAGSLVTDPNEISQYYFGVPYAQLTPEQQALINMMAG